MRSGLLLLLLLGCGKDKAAPITLSDTAEAATKDIAQIKAALAANNSNRAVAVCAVAKPGVPTLTKKEPALAADLTRLCTRDVPLFESSRALEKIEANKKPDPTGLRLDCASRKSYAKWIAQGGFAADPEVVALEKRWDAACPPTGPRP